MYVMSSIDTLSILYTSLILASSMLYLFLAVRIKGIRLMLCQHRSAMARDLITLRRRQRLLLKGFHFSRLNNLVLIIMTSQILLVVQYRPHPQF